ncbi:MAG: PstS family phosphate ABC transporter substrate-binding protein [Elainellaceae cyanobacterium]
MPKSRFNSLETIIFAALVTPFLAGGLYAVFSPSISKLVSKGKIAPSANALMDYPNTFADVEAVPSGTFTYGGSTTWAPVRNELDRFVQQAHPSFQLRYIEDNDAKPGSGTGIQMLLENQLSFAQTSRTVKEQEREQAEALGITISETPIAIDAIAFGVNPALSVNRLSLDEIGRIYRGEITNWQDVGGPDLAITPYTRPPQDSGTVGFFVDNVMDGADFGNQVVFVETLTVGLRQLASDPGGIYYGSAPEIVPQCEIKPIALINEMGVDIPAHQNDYIPPSQCPDARNQINSAAFQAGAYPLTRQLYVIARDNDESSSEAAKAYAQLLLSDEGQRLIQEIGFVPIRNH